MASVSEYPFMVVPDACLAAPFPFFCDDSLDDGFFPLFRLTLGLRMVGFGRRQHVCSPMFFFLLDVKPLFFPLPFLGFETMAIYG